jgi:hypothetical protein
MGIDNSQTGPDFATVDPSAVNPNNQTATASPQMMKTATPTVGDVAGSPTHVFNPQTNAIEPIAPGAQAKPPSVTTPPVAPSPNQRLHSFVSSVLGGITSSLAGKAPVTYTTDAAGRVVAAPQQPEDTRKAQMRRIAGNALSGLAAGSRVPQQKSGLASALSGLGAGAEAQTAQATAADAAARKEARENDEAAQKRILQQHDIARTNALTYSTYSHDMREEDEHDPQRKKYSQWADAAEAGGLDVRTMSEKEAKAAQASDPSFATNHLLLAGGFKPQTGPNGEVLMDPKTQQPLRDGQVLVIQGGHMDANGNKVVSLPASLVNDVHKYGDLLGVSNAKGLKEGDEVDAEQFFKLIGVAQEGNKKQQEGWLKPIITVDQDTGKKFEKNNNTGEVREAKAIPTADVKNLADANKKDMSGEVTPLEKFKQDREDQRARIRKASDDKAGQNTDVFGNVSTLSEKEFNKRYDSFNKSKQYQTLGVLQGSYDQFQQAVKDIDSGKPLSGAQSVVQLFNAIGISATPLAGKGFRINENTVKEHVEARGLDQSALQKLEKLETGAVITEKQLKDYAGIAAQVYKNSFINAAKEQKRQLGYIDVLPLGNNEPVDAMTASLYLQTAGGDRAKAESALKKSGWLIPQR